MFWTALITAAAMLTPAWSIHAQLDHFDAAASSALAARAGAQSASASAFDTFEEAFEEACLLDDEEFWLHARAFLPPPDITLNDRIERMRARLSDQLEMQDPPGTVFAAAGYRYPDQSSDLGEALIARAQFDQLIRAMHVDYLLEGESRRLEAVIALALSCQVGRANGSFLYRATLAEGFPSHRDYGHPAENAAILIAKHINDEGEAAFVTAAAGFAAGAERISSTSFGYLLDSFSINLLGGQLLGTYVRCENAEAISEPPVIDSEAVAFWRAELSVPDRETLDALACPEQGE